MAGCSITLLRLDDELTRLWDAPGRHARPAVGRVSAAARRRSTRRRRRLAAGVRGRGGRAARRAHGARRGHRRRRPRRQHGPRDAGGGREAAGAEAAGGRRRGSRPLGPLFKTAGMTLVSTVGGAAGPLYGTLFLEMGKAAAEQDRRSTAAEWAGVVERGRRRGADARQGRGRATRRWSTRCCRRRRRCAPPPAPARRCGGALRAAADAAARGHASDRPAGRAQGPRQLPGRAQRRASGPGRDVVVAAAADGGGRDAGRRGAARA